MPMSYQMHYLGLSLLMKLSLSVSLSTYLTVEQASLLAPLIAHFGEDMVREVLDAALHALANGVPLV